MPSRALTTVPKTYAELKRAVQAVVLRGRRSIERAWLLTYHETGRLIHVHLLLNKDRADYGANVFVRLAADTGISSRTLHEFVQFYRYFPIVRAPAQLSWNHYRILCQVADPARRKALLTETVKRGWTSPQLEQQVRALALPEPGAAEAAKNVTPPKLLTPKRGTVGVCRVVASGGGLALDLGFTSYVDLPAATKLREGDFVRFEAAGEFEAAPDASKADLYTYRAEILRVVDGDTLWMKIYLRPDLWVKEKLRLRGLDCPEMVTPEGKAAKRFVETLVAGAKSVTITTFKPDKWDRYLSDVFLAVPSDLSAKASATAEASAKEGAGSDGEMFLNNHLLAAGHARRMDEYALTDWDGGA